MKREILSRGACKCLKYLKSYDFQKRGWACPSIETLMADMRRSDRQVKRYVVELTRKYYIEVSRRPNASNKYTFLGNVTSDVTQSGTADVPAHGTTFSLILKSPNSQPQNTTPQEIPMQEYDAHKIWEPRRSPEEIRLRKMALRYDPDLMTLDIPVVCQQLEAAGALALPEGAALPSIPWVPWKERLRQIDAAKSVRSPHAKPPAMAQGLAELSRKLGS